MRHLRIILLSLLLSSLHLYGQDRMLVFGMVRNPIDDNKPITDTELRIIGYNTVAEAQDVKAKFEAWQKAGAVGSFQDFGLIIETTPDLGYYEIQVYPNGALLLVYPSAEVQCKLVPVNGKNEINISFNMSRSLEGSIKEEEYSVHTKIPPIDDFGNFKGVQGTYVFPRKRLAKKNSRFVMQYFVVDGENRADTLEFRVPIVLDGDEYHATQLRRMAYKGERDPLFRYADSTRERLRALGEQYILDENYTSISWKDSIYFDDPDKFVLIPKKLWLEDYTGVYFSDTLYEDTKRTIKKMRFLEYSLEVNNLDASSPEYRRRATRTKVDDARDLSLNFLPSSAKLDPSDTLGAKQLAGLRNDINNLIRNESEGYTLKTLFVSGVASPEGSLDKNNVLAHQRMSFLSDQLLSIIPRARQERMVKNFSSRVAGWEEVADLLWADSLKAEAGKIRDIVARHPGRPDAQGAAVRALPFYKTLIAERLPKLRTVKVEYTYEVFRELTPEEIYYRYKNDPSYTAPGTVLPLYEYYALFQVVKDTEEFEALCRSAINAAEKSGDRWPLPANLLASSLISRGEADTTILAPFIEENKMVNQPWTDFKTGRKYTVNPDAVVANQVIMMLGAKKFNRARQLIYMKGLPTKYEYLRIITDCLSKRKPEQRDYEILSQTSPRNMVVMAMAMSKWPIAKEALDNLDESDPISHYLKAQFYSAKAMVLENKDKYKMLSREPEYNLMMRELVKAFQMDPSLTKIAASDAWIFEDLYEEALKVLKNPSLLDFYEDEDMSQYYDLYNQS